MYGLLLGIHLVVCLVLVAVVLVQSGKGGGLTGGAFGGSAQTVFGGRGATDFITRATMVLAGTFFLTSLVLALMSSGGQRTRSLIQEQARQASPAVPAPQRPGATAPQGGGAAGSGSLVPTKAPAGGTAPAPAVGTAPKPTPAGTAPAPAGTGNPAPAGAGATKPPGGGP